MHAFTHYRLHVRPWLVFAASHTALRDSGQPERWIAAQHLSDTALPAPVKKLLAGIASDLLDESAPMRIGRGG
jgi:A/G-specific adenine glycosylase